MSKNVTFTYFVLVVIVCLENQVRIISSMKLGSEELISSSIILFINFSGVARNKTLKKN